jgi:protein TonB
MSGSYLHLGSSFLTPAAAAHPGVRAGGGTRGIPSISLALSGAFHAAIVPLLVIANARAPLEREPVGIPMAPHLWTPRIEIRGESMAPGRTRPPDAGTYEPVAKRDRPDLTTEVPEFGALGPVVEGAAGRAEPGRGPAVAGPATAEEGTDAFAPSLYEAAPEVVEAPAPEYPPIAREAGIEGTVIVEALVTSGGAVGKVRVRQGNPMLAEAAAKAVWRWRFRPAEWNGKPVPAWVSVPVVFRLQF